MQSKLAISTLYKREYLVTIDDDLESLQPFQVIFRALSVRDLDYIRSLYPTSETNQINLATIEKSIVSIINATYTDGTSLTTADYHKLPQQILSNIAKNITAISVVTEELISKISINVTLAIDSKYQADTWNCDMCRERKLDTVRNCKYRPDYLETFDKNFRIIVSGTSYDHCPMYYKDSTLLSDIFNAYYGWEQGVLPDGGSLVDQTEFFMVAVLLVKKAVKEQEANNK